MIEDRVASRDRKGPIFADLLAAKEVAEAKFAEDGLEDLRREIWTHGYGGASGQLLRRQAPVKRRVRFILRPAERVGVFVFWGCGACCYVVMRRTFVNVKGSSVYDTLPIHVLHSPRCLSYTLRT
jgi:hypothetical protein